MGHPKHDQRTVAARHRLVEGRRVLQALELAKRSVLVLDEQTLAYLRSEKDQQHPNFKKILFNPSWVILLLLYRLLLLRHAEAK